MQSLTLSQIIARLSRLLSIELAAEWDNVGLLVGDHSSTIKNIFITNDLTKVALNNAIQKSQGNPGLIITYHPILFRPIKTITTESDWQKEIILRCIENRLAIFSPHTALDAMFGGVNDWLASMFGRVNSDFSSEPIEKPAISSNTKFCHITDSPIEQKSDVASFTIGKSNFCTTTYSTDKTKYKFEIPAEYVVGAGRILTLSQPKPLSEIVKTIKNFLNLQYLRTTSISDPIIHRIGICPGAGSSMLKRIPPGSVFLTGEMGHHRLLEAVHKNVYVILTEHSNCERAYLTEVLAKTLSDVFEGIRVETIEDGGDPVNFA